MAQRDPLVDDGFHVMRDSSLRNETTEQLLHGVHLIQQIPHSAHAGWVECTAFFHEVPSLGSTQWSITILTEIQVRERKKCILLDDRAG